MSKFASLSKYTHPLISKQYHEPKKKKKNTREKKKRGLSWWKEKEKTKHNPKVNK
jgi:hypothetical protein